MRRWATAAAAILGLIGGSVSAAGSLGAQVWQGDFGVAAPVGELSEIFSPGPTIAVTVSHSFQGETGLRVRGEAGLLRSTRVDVRPLHLLAGPFWTLRRSDDGGWEVSADAFLGGTYFWRAGDLVMIPESPTPRELQLSRSLSASAGLQASRPFGDGVELVLHARFVRMFTSGEESTGVSGAVEEGFGALSMIPFGVGLRWIR